MGDKIEAAKSSRAACRLCGEKIKKGELRFGEEYESEYGLSFRWYHLPCAAKKLPALFRGVRGGALSPRAIERSGHEPGSRRSRCATE